MNEWKVHSLVACKSLVHCTIKMIFSGSPHLVRDRFSSSVNYIGIIMMFSVNTNIIIDDILGDVGMQHMKHSIQAVHGATAFLSYRRSRYWVRHVLIINQQYYVCTVRRIERRWWVYYGYTALSRLGLNALPSGCENAAAQTDSEGPDGHAAHLTADAIFHSSESRPLYGSKVRKFGGILGHKNDV